MKRKFLIIFSIFALFITVLIIYQINNVKKMNLYSKDSLLSIYIDGVQESTIPSKTSGYEFEKAICDNGTVVDWDYENWALDMSFTSKTKCDLYFVNSYKIRGTATNILSSFAEYNTSVDVINKGWSNTFGYDLTTDNNLRYVGADPKNYVQFNGELWRIIGVMNNVENSSGQSQSLLKIVRNDPIGQYSWDTSASSINSGDGINQWAPSEAYEGADLMRELNTDYLGDITVGSDGKWFNGSKNKKTADMPTTLLNSDSQSMIESVVWYLGVPGNVDGTFSLGEENTITPRTVYEKERTGITDKSCSSTSSSSYCNDSVVRTSNWTGKVALVYLSDYGFSTSGGNSDNRDACLDIPISNNVSMATDGWDKHADCFKNSWILDIFEQWSLVPSGYSYVDVYSFVYDSNSWLSSVGFSRRDAYVVFRVRPVVYLKSNISINGGSGSKFDPYILSNTATT